MASRSGFERLASWSFSAAPRYGVFQSDAHGVGKILAAPAIVGLQYLCPRPLLVWYPLPVASVFVGVGQTPPPMSLVRGSDIGSAQHTPPRIIPERGQVPENHVESAISDSWAVLQHDESWQNDTGHPDNFFPQTGSGSVADACAAASRGYILAREARMQAIHSAGVPGWIEHPHVSFVHVQTGEPCLGGSLAQDGAAVGIPLDGADGLMAEDEVGEESAAGAGEEVEGLEHDIIPPPAARRGRSGSLRNTASCGLPEELAMPRIFGGSSEQN
jgi:hypothetical protein